MIRERLAQIFPRRRPQPDGSRLNHWDILRRLQQMHAEEQRRQRRWYHVLLDPLNAR